MSSETITKHEHRSAVEIWVEEAHFTPEQAMIWLAKYMRSFVELQRGRSTNGNHLLTVEGRINQLQGFKQLAQIQKMIVDFYMLPASQAAELKSIRPEEIDFFKEYHKKVIADRELDLKKVIAQTLQDPDSENFSFDLPDSMPNVSFENPMTKALIRYFLHDTQHFIPFLNPEGLYSITSGLLSDLESGDIADTENLDGKQTLADYLYSNRETVKNIRNVLEKFEIFLSRFNLEKGEAIPGSESVQSVLTYLTSLMSETNSRSALMSKRGRVSDVQELPVKISSHLTDQLYEQLAAYESHFDVWLLIRVFFNLLSNARKAMATTVLDKDMLSSLVVEMNCDINLQSQGEQYFLIISITDKGPGFPLRRRFSDTMLNSLVKMKTVAGGKHYFPYFPKLGRTKWNVQESENLENKVDIPGEGIGLVELRAYIKEFGGDMKMGTLVGGGAVTEIIIPLFESQTEDHSTT